MIILLLFNLILYIYKDGSWVARRRHEQGCVLSQLRQRFLAAAPNKSSRRKLHCFLNINKFNSRRHLTLTWKPFIHWSNSQNNGFFQSLLFFLTSPLMSSVSLFFLTSCCLLYTANICFFIYSTFFFSLWDRVLHFHFWDPLSKTFLAVSCFFDPQFYARSLFLCWFLNGLFIKPCCWQNLFQWYRNIMDIIFLSTSLLLVWNDYFKFQYKIC